METSDDPITMLLIGGAAVGGAAMGGAFSKPKTGGGAAISEMPTVEAEQATRTAQPLEQISEQAKKSRRKAAAALSKDFGAPKLGSAGLLGISRS